MLALLFAPLENGKKVKGKSEKQSFVKYPSVKVRVVTEWFPKRHETLQSPKAHKCPTDVLLWSPNLRRI